MSESRLEETEATLSGWDIAVLVLTLAISAGIGVYHRFTGGRQKTAREFLMANREMAITPVAFSLMASFMSAVTLLGVPKENYFYGSQFFIINFAYLLGTPLAAFVFLPVFFRLQVVSAYEYLEMRFGRPTRLLVSAVFIVQMTFYMSVVVYAPAVTLHAVTPLSKWAAILSVGAVCTFYSSIGGMKAVLWTDVFQSILMFASMLAILVVGTNQVGGLGNVIRAAQDGGRLNFWNFSFDPEERHTLWALLFGGVFTYLSLYAVNQTQVQRLLTVKRLKTAQLALVISWPILIGLSFMSCLIGLVIYTNFKECDPYITGKISAADQILPYFVMKYFGGFLGLPGLFVAGIFSGALSTVSSAINSLAAVSYEDFVKPARKGNDSHESIIIKSIAFLYGVICVLMAGMAEKLGGVLQASFVFFGIFGGPLLGAFCLGMLIPKCSQKSAIIGVACGLLAGVWIGAGALLEGAPPDSLPLSNDDCHEVPIVKNITAVEKSCSVYLPLCNLSYQWYTFASWLVTVAVGVLTSFIWPTEASVSKKLLSPILLGEFGEIPTSKDERVESHKL